MHSHSWCTTCRAHRVPRYQNCSMTRRAPAGLVLCLKFRPACPWRRAIAKLGSLGLDVVRGHGGRLVAEARANIGGDGRNLGIGKLLAKRWHEDVIACALDRDRSLDAEKQDAGNCACIATYPFGSGQRREYAGQSSPCRLMTGCTAADKKLRTICGNGRRGLWFGCLWCDGRDFGRRRRDGLCALVEQKVTDAPDTERGCNNTK